MDEIILVSIVKTDNYSPLRQRAFTLAEVYQLSGRYGAVTVGKEGPHLLVKLLWRDPKLLCLSSTVRAYLMIHEDWYSNHAEIHFI